MKKTVFNATSLRIFMTVLFVLMVVFSIVGFYFAQRWLNSQSLLMNQKNNTPSSNTNTQLPDTAVKASDKSLTVFVKQDYLDVIKNDLNVYAQKTGVTIDSVDTYTGPGGTLQPIATGVNAVTLQIKLKEPIKSSNFVTFIKAVESNLPVMRLTSLKINSGGNNSGDIAIEELLIQIYVKG